MSTIAPPSPPIRAGDILIMYSEHHQPPAVMPIVAVHQLGAVLMQQPPADAASPSVAPGSVALKVTHSPLIDSHGRLDMRAACSHHDHMARDVVGARELKTRLGTY